MNKQREQKNYINYFKKWDGMGMLGAILMIVGFACLWLGRSFAAYVMAVFLMPIGIAVFLYGSIGRASESDFKNEIEDRMEAIGFREVEEEPRFRRRYAKEPEILTFSDYLFREGVMLKRRKSGALCSSAYLCAQMMILTDAFYVKMREFSFVSDDVSNRDEEILFSEIESIGVVRDTQSLTFGKGSYTARTCNLVITYNGGKTCALPIKDDIYAEQFAERLERIVKGAKS